MDQTEQAGAVCFLRLAACTGARRSQLLAVRWRDVDWHRAALAFTRGLVVGPKGLELRAAKTHRTYRVELDPETRGALMEHRSQAQTNARTEQGADLSRDAFVFSHHADGREPWLPNWTTKEFVRARRAATISPSGSMTFVISWRLRCSPRRAYRHGFATAQPRAGLHHVDVNAHSVPGGDRAAAEALSAILSTAHSTGA